MGWWQLITLPYAFTSLENRLSTVSPLLYSFIHIHMTRECGSVRYRAWMKQGQHWWEVVQVPISPLMHSVMTIRFEQAETVRAARALLEVVPCYSFTCVNKYTQTLADNLTTSALAQSKGPSPTWSLSHTQLVPDHATFHTCLWHHMLVKTAGSSGKCKKHCHTLDISEAMNVINFYLSL